MKVRIFLRRFNAPVGEVGGVALSYVCLYCKWDNSIISLKLLTNQQRDGDGPVESIVTGLLEKRRKGTMNGIRKFIAVDNHEAVNVGGLRQDIKSFEVVKPKF